VSASPSSCACGSGFVAQSDVSNCVACDSTCTPSSGRPPCLINCVECKSGHCLTCQENYYLQTDSFSCLSACSNGYYPSSGRCIQCKNNCSTCTSASSCQSCNSGFTLINEICTLGCYSGFFLYNSTECRSCDPSCLTCTGPAPSNCLECAHSLYPQPGSNLCLQCTWCQSCANNGFCLSCQSGWNLTVTGLCKQCENCTQRLSATLGNPKPNVYSVAFNRPVNHTFSSEDFAIEVKPPASNLSWSVVNNPSDRRLTDTLTGLVYVNIISGQWDSKAVFGISFSSSSILKDEFGNALPALNFTSAPPLGPDIMKSTDSEGNSSGTSMKQLAIIIGCSVGGLVICGSGGILLLWWRLRKRAKTVTIAKYATVHNNSCVSHNSFT